MGIKKPAKIINILGLTGKMGSGKSTAARIIIDFAPEARLIKFAQPLYDIHNYAYERINREPMIKDRKLLQWLGTEWGRSIDKNIWVEIWKREVEEILMDDPEAIILCDDVRFDNEARAIRDMGGMMIEIRCDKERIVKTGTAHASEKGVKRQLIDCVINNDFTVEDLEENILYLLTDAGTVHEDDHTA